MLKTTLGTTFTPGVNLKGEAVGANWSFFLPSLQVKSVVVVGPSSAATLKMLRRLTDSISILCRNREEQQKMEAAEQKLALPLLTWLLFTADQALPLPAQSVDLIVITDKRTIRWVERTPALWRELQRLLQPHGILYYEYHGRLDPLRAMHSTVYGAMNHNTPQLSQHKSQPASDHIPSNGAAQSFWLTPLRGEMQTAVLLDDQATIDFCLQHGLYRSSVDLNTWRSLAKRIAPQRQRSRLPQAKTERAHPAKRRSKRTLRSWLSTQAKRLLIKSSKLLEQAERFAYQQPLIGKRLQRRGVLLSPEATPTQSPPDYIRSLAQKAGISLENFRWVLSARGEYSTRKVLFFLFAPGAQSPTYIVKMTRDPAMNYRLENEYQALAELYTRSIGNAEILPKPLFFGHHAHLAIVGESIIEGSDFSAHTQRNATCPALHAAVDFFVTLGAATVDITSASPKQAAQVLQTLFTRFNAIYQLTPEHQSFLADQINQLCTSVHHFPLVFQHGDPGPWNMLVTPNGRIAMLDWEAAEPRGIPLWDLFYFLRSYAVDVARASGVHDVLQGFRTQFLADTPLSRSMVDAIQRYCVTIGVPAEIVTPLFYTCWMHRALKEATRLPVNQVETGRFVSLLRLCIDNRTAPTLERLAQIPTCELGNWQY